MMPGVPDFYQGTEFWDLSLVDPDNRRPVDFTERADVLKLVERPDWQELARDWPNGHVKLARTRHLLRLRNELADVFASGDYEPLEVSGPHADHVMAFARRRGRHAAITAVARLYAPLSQQGRIWPRGEAFEGEIHLDGYSLEGATRMCPGYRWRNCSSNFQRQRSRRPTSAPRNRLRNEAGNSLKKIHFCFLSDVVAMRDAGTFTVPMCWLARTRDLHP
jgi:hypothetical protein